MIENPAGSSIFIDFEGDDVILQDDVFIKFMHISKKKNGTNRMICRCGFNTSFLNPKEKRRNLPVSLEESKDQEQGLGGHDFEIRLDRFLVDPNSCSKDEAFRSPDFMLILGFADLGQGEDVEGKESDWQVINRLMDQRKA